MEHPSGHKPFKGGAAVSAGAAFKSRVRGAAAASPVGPGTCQHGHAGHIRTTSQQEVRAGGQIERQSPSDKLPSSSGSAR